MSAGILGAEDSLPNTRRQTTTVQSPNRPASKYRASFALRSQEIPFRPNSTIVGMRIRSEMMFEESRVVHNIQ